MIYGDRAACCCDGNKIYAGTAIRRFLRRVRGKKGAERMQMRPIRVPNTGGRPSVPEKPTDLLSAGEGVFVSEENKREGIQHALTKLMRNA